MKYFCDKCAIDPTVSKTVGINPIAVVTSCLHCGTPINTAQENLTLEERVARLERTVFAQATFQYVGSNGSEGTALPQQPLQVNPKSHHYAD